MNTKEVLLSILMRGPATGYDIKKTLETRIANILDVSVSNLYPALNELASEGLVTCQRVEQDSRPAKKIYELTETGRESCIAALMSSEPRHRIRSEFWFILAYAPFLPKERVRQLVDQRLAEIGESFERIKEIRRTDVDESCYEGQSFVLGLASALYEGERAYIERYRDTLLTGVPEQNAPGVGRMTA